MFSQCLDSLLDNDRSPVSTLSFSKAAQLSQWLLQSSLLAKPAIPMHAYCRFRSVCSRTDHAGMLGVPPPAVHICTLRSLD